MFYRNNEEELMGLLLSLQERSAPITMSIGYTTKDGQVHRGILIHEAPPVVTETLVKRGYSLTLMSAGMLVNKF